VVFSKLDLVYSFDNQLVMVYGSLVYGNKDW